MHAFQLNRSQYNGNWFGVALQRRWAYQRNFSTSGPVTGKDDLGMQNYASSHPGKLSLLPSVGR